MTDHETFDLADATTATIETTVRDAFADPFAGLTEMIRLTFVTGAGKLGRARYDENAARALTNTLRELGYEEDRGASAIWECSGTFKLQHDTGKNLKTVVVFPKVQVQSGSGIASSMAGLGVGSASSEVSMIPEDSIDHKLAHTTMNVFPRMIESKCETWSQKKGCVSILTVLKETAESLDAKLVQGQPLTNPENDFYNSVSLTSLEEKLSCVRNLMAQQVDGGAITAEEKAVLLEQVTDRIECLEEEINEAKNQGKNKRVETLTSQQVKARTRKEKLQGTTAKPPPPLKNEEAIAKLRKELTPLLEVEEAAKGRLLTLKESQVMARKDVILEEITSLEELSRGWFESDDTFDKRIKISRLAFEKLRKQAAAKKKNTASTNKSSLPASTKWVVPGAKKTNSWAKPAKKSAPANGNLFAAMMNDSDSD